MSDRETNERADDPVATNEAAGVNVTPPAASEALAEALAGAVRRVGIDAEGDEGTGAVVWKAVGGWRGIAESVLPSLVFVVVFTLSTNLVLSLALSLGLAALFTVVRLLARQSAQAAFGGLIAAGAAAALALWTGRAADNFVWGLVTNAAYGSVFLISTLIGWSVLGLAIGFLMGEGTAWRADRRKRRAFFWLGIAWSALFLARLAVQLPIYLQAVSSGDPDAGAALLGTVKLAMGLPLFAPLVAVSWLVVRALYRAPAGDGDDTFISTSR